MKRTLLIGLALGMAVTASVAEQPMAPPSPPAFAPFLVDQSIYEQTRRMLGQLKLDDVLPVVAYWERLEVGAQEREAKTIAAAQAARDKAAQSAKPAEGQ